MNLIITRICNFRLSLKCHLNQASFSFAVSALLAIMNVHLLVQCTVGMDSRMRFVKSVKVNIEHKESMMTMYGRCTASPTTN